MAWTEQDTEIARAALSPEEWARLSSLSREIGAMYAALADAIDRGDLGALAGLNVSSIDEAFRMLARVVGAVAPSYDFHREIDGLLVDVLPGVALTAEEFEKLKRENLS